MVSALGRRRPRPVADAGRQASLAARLGTTLGSRDEPAGRDAPQGGGRAASGALSVSHQSSQLSRYPAAVLLGGRRVRREARHAVLAAPGFAGPVGGNDLAPAGGASGRDPGARAHRSGDRPARWGHPVSRGDHLLRCGGDADEARGRQCAGGARCPSANTPWGCFACPTSTPASTSAQSRWRHPPGESSPSGCARRSRHGSSRWPARISLGLLLAEQAELCSESGHHSDRVLIRNKVAADVLWRAGDSPTSKWHEAQEGTSPGITGVRI